ncbi:putative glycosyltransferase At5g03795 [Tasmannia lanceolata]|uniref:putative glycosyltransferase At5g03795 n=1 Tax=Tasmannia lanceolata TaxID=3420 RepID=UPI004063BA2E
MVLLNWGFTCLTTGNGVAKRGLDMKKLAFFAGSINSPVREKLVETWKNDSEISVHFGRLTTPYSDQLLGSKFCLHVKGFGVNTARVADALYYGCVPIIIANHYDLPFVDILNWKSFSLVVATLDIPLLKKILHGISLAEYKNLERNVMKMRKHFQWNLSPVDYDAFYMVMYELWLRRSVVRIPLHGVGLIYTLADKGAILDSSRSENRSILTVCFVDSRGMMVRISS